MRKWLKEPEPNRELDRFRDGLAALYRDGEHAGYVATDLSTFGQNLSRQKQWLVRMIVVFNDSSRHHDIEDHEPWTDVQDMLDGYFNWQQSTAEEGPYTVEWVAAHEARRMREQLGIGPSDF